MIKDPLKVCTGMMWDQLDGSRILKMRNELASVVERLWDGGPSTPLALGTVCSGSDLIVPTLEC
eukprot:5620846-Pyramimonas_sp.AAC.2